MTARDEFMKRRGRFSNLYEACLDFHEILEQNQQGNWGHGFDHDLLVAQYGALIGTAHFDEQVADKVWVAGLLHSYDRHEPHLPIEAMKQKVQARLLLVPQGAFSKQDIAEIEYAVFNHTGPNSDDDTPTKICLQDADRLAGIGPMTFIRSGQAFPNTPLIQMDFTRFQRADGSTYREPTSCHDDILGTLEWQEHPQFGLRLAESKRLAKPHFKATYEALMSMYSQLKEAGLEG